MLIHLYIVYGCFCAISAELSICNRVSVACKPKICTFYPLKEKFADSRLSIFPSG